MQDMTTMEDISKKILATVEEAVQDAKSMQKQLGDVEKVSLNALTNSGMSSIV
jgi:hypothetical protein